ncbi:hypothetical protein NIIg32_gp62 [Parageobacillus phage vB_PtoS_NIIg3.2]|nr:hypothetical protein NIIg32_gp62 [Parageobacillus phage vB_PtoS_NIIg3.2]
MNDKERLEFIVGNWEYGRCVRPEDVEWLIEQVEKIEHLNLKYNASLDAIVGFVQELQQAQAKIERCKEIFKDIREASSDIYALRKAEQALQALEGEE